MNQFISVVFISALSFSNYSAVAADQNNTEKAKDGLTQDQTNPDKEHMSSKMMDADGDGMVSKDEFMAHHNKAYSKMKQSKGGVSIKDMDAQMNIGTTKGNKLQPSSATGAAPVSNN